jgi:hypothetical protein
MAWQKELMMRTVPMALGVGFLTLGVLYGVGILRVPQPERHAPDVVEHSVAPAQGQAAELAALAHDLTSLRAELTILQQQQRGLGATLPAIQRQLDTQQAALVRRPPRHNTGAQQRRGAPSGDAARTDQGTALDDTRQGPLDNEAQRAQVQQELLAFEEQLTAEVPDPRGTAWATTEIERGLEEHNLLGTQLVASQCGATLCRLEFVFEDGPGRDMALGQLPFVLPTAGGGVWFVDPEDPLRVIFFTDRHAR